MSLSYDSFVHLAFHKEHLHQGTVFHFHRAALVTNEPVFDQLVSTATDIHFTGLATRFHSCCQVNRVTPDVVRKLAFTNDAGYNGTRMNADAYLKKRLGSIRDSVSRKQIKIVRCFTPNVYERSLWQMTRRTTLFLLVIFIALELVYSSFQHYFLPMDGDLARIALPDLWHQPVLNDPFGFNVLANGDRYAGTNRFFAHWSQSTYFKTIPLLLQLVVSPIESVYLSSAFIKVATQILLLWFLAAFASGTNRITNTRFIIAAALIVPLFHVNGFSHKLTLVHPAITYTFFYSLPFALLLLFFLPFYRCALRNQWNLTVFQKTALACLLVVLPFSGPLIPPLLLIVCMITLGYYIIQSFNNTASGSLVAKTSHVNSIVPKPVFWFFIPAMTLSLYSMYIGTFNIENQPDVSIAARYRYLVTGAFNFLFTNPGFPLLILMITVNVFLLRRTAFGNWNVFYWTGIFSIVYILLLPLGGYRTYRPNILNGDTLIPVTACLVYLYGFTTLHLLNSSQYSSNNVYKAVLFLLVGIFVFADGLKPTAYRCERNALERLAASPDSIVHLDVPCTVMAWREIETPEQSSTNVAMLEYWTVIDKKKLYTTVQNK